MGAARAVELAPAPPAPAVSAAATNPAAAAVRTSGFMTTPFGFGPVIRALRAFYARAMRRT